MSIKNKKGFSLIELMVAVAIISISLAIGVPAFLANVPTRKTKAVARDLVSDIQWTRMQGVMENTNTYYMSFDQNNHSYTIFNDNLVTNGALDNNELIRTVNFNQEYTTIEYGFVKGVKDPETNVNFVLNAVDLLPNFQISFSSQGTISQSGYIYLKPSDDTTGENLMAVQISRAGSLEVWSYDPSNSTWK